MVDATAAATDLGPAPILDFDGTLARLLVDWAALRGKLGVARIDDLWGRAGTDAGRGWSDVTDAEVAAAAQAVVLEPVCSLLHDAGGFAVLTSNSERAVEAFLTSHVHLQAKVLDVVGRESLAGPKTDFERFTAGFERCVRATTDRRAHGAVVYVGDQPYELDFARRLGAVAVDVAEIRTANGDRR